MANVTLDGEGIIALRRIMHKVGDDFADMKALNLSIAKQLAVQIRAKAPTNSGKLMKSVRPFGFKNTATIRLGSKLVPYARINQWGSKTTPRDPNTPKNYPSNPFAWSTVKNAKPWIYTQYNKYCHDKLDEITSAIKAGNLTYKGDINNDH